MYSNITGGRFGNETRTATNSNPPDVFRR